MNEFLRNFVMKTLNKMIDNNIAEWQVREYALGWYAKGVLTEEDLQEIDERYNQPEPEETEENATEQPVEENVEKNTNEEAE